MHALLARNVDAAHDRAGAILDGDEHGDFLFGILRTNILVTGERIAAAILTRLLLSSFPTLLERVEAIAQIHRQDRPIVGVGRMEERRALRAETGVETEATALNVERRFAHGEQVRRLLQQLVRQFAQRGVIIQDVEAATERTEDQVVLAALDFDVAHGHRGQAALHAQPLGARIERHVDTVFRAAEQQIRLHVVFSQRPDDIGLGQRAGQ